MLATGPRVLNSAPPMLFWMDHAHFCRWVVLRAVPGTNNVIIGAVPALCALCPRCAKTPPMNAARNNIHGRGSCQLSALSSSLHILKLELHAKNTTNTFIEFFVFLTLPTE